MSGLIDMWTSEANKIRNNNKGQVKDQDQTRGMWFGFVRFINSGDVEAFERRLRGIMIGFRNLVINRAKFLKNGGANRSTSDFPPFDHSDHGRTRAEKKETTQSFRDADIKINEHPHLRIRLECCLTAKANNIHNSKDSAKSCMENNIIWLQQWFDDIKPWEDSSESCGRLSFEGLPNLGRNVGAIKTVLRNFGRVMECSRFNAKNLTHILKCFEFGSGLKVNFSKSRLFGISIPSNEVEAMASSLGCAHDILTFIYLGLPVSKRMSLCDGWNEVINQFRDRISSWKAKSLSIDGRPTLINSILDSHGICWVKWKSILLDHKFSGLGVCCLHSKYLGLLGKWKWRFFTEENGIWWIVIKDFNGADGGLGSSVNSNASGGIWQDILKAVKLIENIDISFKYSFTCKISSGTDTMFWKGSWCGDDTRLMDKFPRLYALESDKDCMVRDRWCSVNEFGVAFGLGVLPYVGGASIDILATRPNPLSRGVDISSTACPFCDCNVEDIEHCLIKFPKVLPVWKKVWVDNLDRLIDNLSTIWIGRFKLHANEGRFQREPRIKNFQPNVPQPRNNVSIGAGNNSFAAVLKTRTTNPNLAVESAPVIVLDDSCLSEPSGLKINLHKSKLMGIGIPNDVVVSPARFIGCSTLSAPFTYLGVKVGGFMSRLSSWDDIIAKLALSIGGRLTLIKSAIYGVQGALESSRNYSRRSPWIDIICDFRTLTNKGIDLRSLVKKKADNGELTSFGDNIWLADSPLKVLYPRLYYLDLHKQSSVATKLRDSSLISSFRIPPRSGIEEEQLKLLVKSTSSIVLP
uniref:RNA-directed DNA polymerase, eukaryota, reverse transcriptase zinc-binding domain protein n=1 Tax=Tanacetum cinerariifolium TaxID=118510 RepID=A0A6L2N639_TANCI|nr:RNA-directed DNA polymerase, eukaryota, reverse transcriptase zinc-binding domain protein [Tanacetum cinerariifolium]